MATTTNYSWTTPDDTALVKDGAAAIRSLGSAIDTTVFNNANAAIAKTIVDAKGDIIAATAADTVARLAVGANDTVLTADSSTATGLKWAAAASTSAFYPPKVSGFYLYTIGSDLQTSTSYTLNTTYYMPIYLPTCTLDRIGFRTGSHTGTSTIRLGIYKAGANSTPTTLVLDAGTVSPSNQSTTNFSITINQAITDGLHFLAFNQQAVSGTCFVSSYDNGVLNSNFYTGRYTSTLDYADAVYPYPYSESSVSGAFANTTTTTRTAVNNVAMSVRIV